ncbi:MAG: hypothetical protein FJ263_04220 [Planctomycetes bacterium]|nr:hypothetical protein [Planctomycetota bacterium]
MTFTQLLALVGSPAADIGVSADSRQIRSGDEVSVKVYADCGNLVWSQTYDGNDIAYSIPAEITGQHEIDYINFDKDDGTSITKFTSQTLHLSKSDPNIKALIILPDTFSRIGDIVTVSKVQTAFKNRGIKYQKLSLWSATFDNIAWFAQNRNIKYIYLSSHGHYIADDSGTSRTTVKLWDGWAVSVKQSDFPPGQAPSWCERLSGDLELTAKSFASMDFTSLEFAYFDCCYGGRLKISSHGYLIMGGSGQIGLLFDGPHSDMSIALGMNDTSKSRVYQGWYDMSSMTFWWTIWSASEYQKWTRLEWERLGAGDNLYDALDYTINHQTEFDPNKAPVNNYRLKGQGSFTEIKLRSN